MNIYRVSTYAIQTDRSTEVYIHADDAIEALRIAAPEMPAGTMSFKIDHIGILIGTKIEMVKSRD